VGGEQSPQQSFQTPAQNNYINKDCLMHSFSLVVGAGPLPYEVLYTVQVKFDTLSPGIVGVVMEDPSTH
jgi:hypothetical protein